MLLIFPLFFVSIKRRNQATVSPLFLVISFFLKLLREAEEINHV